MSMSGGRALIVVVAVVVAAGVVVVLEGAVVAAAAETVELAAVRSRGVEASSNRTRTQAPRF